MQTVCGLMLVLTSQPGFESSSRNESVPEFLKTLPQGCLPFAEFSQKYNLAATSTEKSNPKTSQLSQIMSQNVTQGLEVLLDVDTQVLEGFERFLPTIHSVAPLIAKKMQEGGRIFLVGAGTSARIGIDIAAKCSKAFPDFKGRIRGVLAGGESVFIRAKEGFEDSEVDGEKALKDFRLGKHDVVILISASGSTSFNVGCGHYAANQGASVFYFYNSSDIPHRTKTLFQRVSNPVTPLELDIGPQAIRGSTRLQAATVTEACLTSVLASALYYHSKKDDVAQAFPKELLQKMKDGLQLIRNKLDTIAKFVKVEEEVFSHPAANFRKLRDETDQGYVTFLSCVDAIREILMDATETSPTFSTNPVRKEGETTKRSEYCAYLVGKGDNNEAWKQVLGREVEQADQNDTKNFLLSVNAKGRNSFENRPQGKGNFVVGVAKLPTSSEVPEELIHLLREVRGKGGEAGIILICNGALSESSKNALQDIQCIVLENVAHDALGLNETLVLKQVLNLISNASMIQMKKVYGNQMVDVRASNMKLVDRSMRMIQDIWSEYGFPELNHERLYHYVCHVSALKKAYEGQEQVQTPSVVKIVLAMLYLEKMPVLEQFQEVVKLLHEKNDELDSILSSGTLCIDGGGSKTLLQAIDKQGKLLPIFRDNNEMDAISTTGSNINVIGVDGVRAAFQSLFKDVTIGLKRHDLQKSLSRFNIVAGMAGVGLAQNKAKIIALFKELGMKEERIRLMTDADAALSLLPSKGIVLISGTGSICFGKRDTTNYRVGGLGSILGDEGSGYQIGLAAVRAGLAEEYGWGDKTSLTEAMKTAFTVSELKMLVSKINSREILPAQIAKVTPLVFEAAEKKDAVAQAIIDDAAKALNQLLVNMLKISNLSNCELHLWGGVFKSSSAESFIKKMDNGKLTERSIQILNRSHENAALLHAKMQIAH